MTELEVKNTKSPNKQIAELKRRIIFEDIGSGHYEHKIRAYATDNPSSVQSEDTHFEPKMELTTKINKIKPKLKDLIRVTAGAVIGLPFTYGYYFFNENKTNKEIEKSSNYLIDEISKIQRTANEFDYEIESGNLVSELNLNSFKTQLLSYLEQSKQWNVEDQTRPINNILKELKEYEENLIKSRKFNEFKKGALIAGMVVVSGIGLTQSVINDIDKIKFKNMQSTKYNISCNLKSHSEITDKLSNRDQILSGIAIFTSPLGYAILEENIEKKYQYNTVSGTCTSNPTFDNQSLDLEVQFQLDNKGKTFSSKQKAQTFYRPIIQNQLEQKLEEVLIRK